MHPSRAPRRTRRLAAAAALVALSLAPRAEAGPTPVVASAAPAPAAKDLALAAAGDRAPFELVVNGVAYDVVVVRVLPDGDVWVPAGALEAAGLRELGGARSRLDGVEGIRLRSLAPDLSFVLDEATLQLRLQASGALLGTTELDAGESRRPAGLLTGGAPSAFANYAVQGDLERQLAAFAEVGAGAGGWLLSSGVSRQSQGTVVRGLSSLTRDEPEHLRRWTAGDAVVTSGPLGGSVVLGGLGVQREFSLDPWYVRQPLPRTSAVALTPSTLEVYVNDRLVRREAVAPGTIDLANVPVEAGAGQVRTVLRDAYGRAQEVTSAYYGAAELLAPGTTDFALHAGVRRESIGSASATYSDAVVLGRWRRGLTDRLTLGARAEGGPSLASAGASLTAGLAVGEGELAAAASGGAGGGGAAGLASWSYASRRASGGLRLQAMSRAYANASLAGSQNRGLLQASAFVGVPVGRGSLGAELSAARMREGEDVVSATLRASASLTRGATLLASAGWARDASGASGPTAMLVLSHVLGDRTTASAQADRTPGARSTASVDVQRTLDNAPGYGYRLDASGGDGAVTSGAVQAQGDHGRIEASYQRVRGAGAGWVTGSGGLVVMDGDAFFTRAVQDGFALVQVPGVAGVRAYLNSAEVGRTDARGNLLVPGLVPYNANRISIRAADVPISYELDAVERLVAPPRRIGGLVRFDARPIQALTGTVTVAEPGRDVTPAYGELRVAGARETSPLGSDGRFYLSSLAAGAHEADVIYAGGTCRIRLVVPLSAAPLTDVGALRCAPAAATVGVPPSGAPSASTVTQTTLASAAGGNVTRTGNGAP